MKSTSSPIKIHREFMERADLVTFRRTTKGRAFIVKNRFSEANGPTSLKILNKIRKENPNRTEIVIFKHKALKKTYEVIPQ